MRALIWIVAIFAIAAGVAMLAGANDGYVLVVAPPWRAQLSLNLVIVALLLSFLTLYVFFRLVGKTLGLPGRVARYRARRRDQKASQALRNALRAFFEGRFNDALGHARTADNMAGPSFEVEIAAAHAAHGLQDRRRVTEWLDKAEASEGGRVPRLLAEAEFAIDNGSIATAREILDALQENGHRSAASRRFRLEVACAEERWDEVIDVVRQLQSDRAIEPEEARRLMREAHVAGFRRRAGDAVELAAYWRDLPKEDIADARLIAEVVPVLATAGQGSLARKTVERLLGAEWNSELARQYALCTTGDESDANDALSRAEKWLVAHPDDAGLLASLGRQCMAAQIWGKAQSYLEESLAREPRADVHCTLAELFEKLERPAEAARHYRDAAKLADSKLPPSVATVQAQSRA